MSHTELEASEIPVIDISSPSPDVAKEVLHAASTHGFLFIKNDGVTIPPQDIDDMFDLSRQFFQSPKEQKSQYAIHSEQAGGKNRGWVTMQGEALDPDGQKQGDPKEAFNIAPAPPNSPLQPLPPPLSTQAALISRFQTSCHELCTRILTLLGTALAIPDPTYFASRHDQSLGPSGSIFRLLYYPKSHSSSSNGGKSIRAGAHSDYGSLTLLFRLPGQAGLELLSPVTQSWLPVPVNPSPTTLSHPPILVNIGDVLSFWTNGMLKSTVHRVTFTTTSPNSSSTSDPEASPAPATSNADAASATNGTDTVHSGDSEERYSIAYFCHPLDGARLDPVPSEKIAEFGDQGREEMERQRRNVGLGPGKEKEGEGEGKDRMVLTAGEHLGRRLKVTYGLDD